MTRAVVLAGRVYRGGSPITNRSTTGRLVTSPLVPFSLDWSTDFDPVRLPT